MTDPIAQARAEGRAEGIREAAGKLASSGLSSAKEWEAYRAILALLDAPAPMTPVIDRGEHEI
jgi:hypothetical protein